MAAPGWLTRSLADVPAADGWLSVRERETLADLHAGKRRADWRLGRWAGKEAIVTWSGAEPAEVEIIASASGAPEPFVSGEPAGASLSLSHRAGRALVVVAEPEAAIGCDLEAVEPRSGAFVRTWLAARERTLVESAGGAGSAHLANLIWAAKEAATKVRREGLRLDVRDAIVELDWTPSGGSRGWRPLSVCWDREGETAHGWWREEPGWIFALVSEPATPEPLPL